MIRNGNSTLIRLPKALVEQCGLGTDLELKVKGHHVVVRSPKRVRHGWNAAFARMREQAGDQLLDRTKSNWDVAQWTW